MELQTILFDLDGTLLPMDLDAFVKQYLHLFAQQMEPHGYVPEKFVHMLKQGIASMVQGDTAYTNEQRFWETFDNIYGAEKRKDMPLFENFYQTGFDALRAHCRVHPDAVATVRQLQAAGYRIALATNPLFPRVATEKRLRWAGFEPEDFALVTTYETAHFCKPNPSYYLEVVQQLDVSPESCLMVGNDVEEDMVAQTVGMRVFLLTHCLINRHETDIAVYPHGDFRQLLQYVQKLKSEK